MSKYKKNQFDIKLVAFRVQDSAYYPFVFYGLIISVCILLVIFVIIPQVQNLFSIQKEDAAVIQKIEMIKRNISYLQSLNDETLDKNVVVANAAFPQNKDFTGGTSAVGNAAAQSGVGIDDFTLVVGSVNPKKPQEERPFGVNVSVHGTLSNVQQFLIAVKQQLPLLSVNSVLVQRDSATVDLTFAYKPYIVPTVSLADTPVNLSPTLQSVLTQLQSWYNPPLENSSEPVNGTLPPF